MLVTRRTLIAGAASAALAPAIVRAETLFTTFPFTLGVASGDPAPDGFVLWTRLAPEPLGEHGGMPMQPVAVEWQVAADNRFRTIVAKGEAIARPELGHSVHVEVAGLEADRPYWYRFLVGRERSLTGRARTLPLARARLDRLRFGVAGCQNYEAGHFTAYRHLAGEDVAFVYHYGDYIYEYSSPFTTDRGSGEQRFAARSHVGQEPFDVAGYRRRYAQYKLDRDLQRAHAAAPWFATFDDHEVVNNWVSDHDPGGAAAEVLRLRRAAALQAWYEHMPVRAALFPAAGAIAMDRGVRCGDLLHAHFLDTRQHRTPQPCGNNFKPRCAEVDRADAQVLGTDQERRLAAALEARPRWHMLAQQVMMMEMDRRTAAEEPAPIHNMDSWPAYAVPRRRLLDRLDGMGNVVVVTGDEHQNFAGRLLREGRPVAVEFVGTSISSGGDGSDVRPGGETIRANNPHLAFSNDQRGYLVCDVGRDEWRTDFMVVDRVSTPGAEIAKRATFAVARGTPDLREV